MSSLDIRALAFAQRFAIWGALAGFIGLLTHPLVSLAAIILMLYCAWRILHTGQFNVPAKVLWLVLMLIPLVNVLALVLLSNRAALKLKAAGVPVGLLGVNSRDLPA